MKRTKTKILSVFLSVCMIVSCMVGMSLTASADVLPFTFNDSGNYSGVYQYTFALSSEQLSKITKIEALIDLEKITGWGGQVVYSKGSADSDRHYALFGNTPGINDIPGIKKYTAGEGTVEGADFAGVQLIGKGALLAYTITFSEGDPIKAGDWNIPQVTAPAAKTGLTATGSAQALVTAGTVTGTGTIEYSLNKTTWNTSVPTGTDAGDYTVYYRVKYGTETYEPLYNGISVTIDEDSGSSDPNAPTVTILPDKKAGKVKVESIDDGMAWQFTATENSGYKFKEWTWKIDTSKGSSSEKTITLDAEEIGDVTDITAVFEEDSSSTTTYTISVLGTTNGTVTADKKTAAANDTVTLTVKPDNGYTVGAVVVASGNLNIYPKQVPGDTTKYTFPMPADDVKVITDFLAAAPAPPPPPMFLSAR